MTQLRLVYSNNLRHEKLTSVRSKMLPATYSNKSPLLDRLVRKAIQLEHVNVDSAEMVERLIDDLLDATSRQ